MLWFSPTIVNGGTMLRGMTGMDGMIGPLGPALVAVWGVFVLLCLVQPLREIFPTVRTTLSRGWHPITAATALSALSHHAEVLLLAGAMAAALWLVGTEVVRWFGSRRTAAIRRFAAYPLGYGAVSLMTLGLALVKLWFPAIMAAALLVPAAAVAATRRPALDRPWLGPGRRLWATAGLVLLFLPSMLAPETQPDGWEYFLAGPERWLAGHVFSAFAATPPLHYPDIAEMLYGLPVACHLDEVPKWLNALLLLSGTLAAAAAWRPGTERWAAMLIATSASGTVVITSGKNEGFCGGYILLAFATGWLQRIPTQAGPGRAHRGLSAGEVLSAAFAGLALGSKPISLLNAAGVPVLLFLLAGPARPRAALAWGALALGVAAPWYAKSWLLTGDPLYPVLAGFRPGLVDGWDHRNGELWHRCSTVPMPQVNLLFRWFDGIVREHAVLAFLLPFAMLAGGPAARLGAVALALHLVWYAAFFSPQTQRWGFPGFSLALILTASAVPEWLPSRSAVIRFRGWMVTACLLGGSVCGVTRLAYAPNPIPLALGMESSAAYRERIMTTRTELDAFLSRSPSGRALILLGDTREYRLPKPVRVGSAHASGEAPLIWRLAEASDSDRDWLAKFRQLNADRIIYNPITAINNGSIFQPFIWTPALVKRWRGFFERWWDLEYAPPVADHANGIYFVYHLRQGPKPPPARLAHLPGTESIAADAMDLTSALPTSRALYPEYLREIDRRAPRIALYQDQAAFLAREEEFNDAAYRLYEPGIRAGLVDDENFPGFGIVALRTGRAAEALAMFQRTAQIYPDWATVMEDYAARARFLMARRLLSTDPGAAERLLSEGVAALTGSPHAAHLAGPITLLRAIRGFARFQLGRPTEAMEDLKAAAIMIPQVGTLPLPELPELFAQAEREILSTTGNEDRIAAQQ